MATNITSQLARIFGVRAVQFSKYRIAGRQAERLLHERLLRKVREEVPREKGHNE